MCISQKLQFSLILISIISCVGCERSFDKNNEDSISMIKDDEMDQNTLRTIYPHLEVVQVTLKTSGYHADRLISATTAEECAYNVIAIGLLGEDTPKVRCALLRAVNHFKNIGLPQGYDWPDNAERFKAFLRKNPGYVVDHYPGNRAVPMLVLIDECVKRLGIEKLTEEEY